MSIIMVAGSSYTGDRCCADADCQKMRKRKCSRLGHTQLMEPDEACGLALAAGAISYIGPGIGR